jgi:alditol oxidase
MSPCYQQDCVAIHFTWKPDWPAVSKLLPVIEKELAPFNAAATLGRTIHHLTGRTQAHLQEDARHY